MQPKLIVIATLFLLPVTSCLPKKDTHQSAEKNQTTMTGKIISQSFVNKVGKEISTIQDLYFETSGETYFIKFMDSNISFEEAEKLLDQTITIEGEIRDGMWDVPDDNPEYAQSRTGEYIVIFSIK